jgi:hypothetical protein
LVVAASAIRQHLAVFGRKMWNGVVTARWREHDGTQSGAQERKRKTSLPGAFRSPARIADPHHGLRAWPEVCIAKVRNTAT